MDLVFQDGLQTDVMRSQEFNGLGTFTHGLHLAGQEAYEYRAIPMPLLPWAIRKRGLGLLLEMERYESTLREGRLKRAIEEWLKWVDSRSFDAFFCRELFSFSIDQLERIEKMFSIRTIWLSWSPGRVHSLEYKKYLSYFTHIFLIDREGVEKLRKEGFNAYYMPLALSDFCTNRSRHKKKYKLGFIGTIYPNRMEMLTSVPEKLLNLWSSNFEKDTAVMYPELKRCFRGSVWGQKMLEKMAEVEILINPVHRSYMLGKTDNVTNFRNFESLGEHTFQLSEFKPAIREIFDENEVATYTCLEDLKSKIDYYLSKPKLCLEMVKRARQKVLSEHLYSHRMKRIVEIVNSD